MTASNTFAHSIEEQAAQPLEDRDSVMGRLRCFDLRLLPPPPACAEAWRDRTMRMCEYMPDLRDHLISVPNGWFSLVEMAVAEGRRLLTAGQSLQTTQMKEKFGTLRWYCHVATEPDSWDYNAPAIGPMGWAEEASGQICAALGTPDGTVDCTDGWVLTLSPVARQMRKRQAGIQGMALSTLMYPPWIDT